MPRRDRPQTLGRPLSLQPTHRGGRIELLGDRDERPCLCAPDSELAAWG